MAKRPHLTNASYWDKPNNQLIYIMRDAYMAAECMKHHDPVAEAKYLEQMNDACTVITYRKGH
jgi:hypothetical protein